MPDQVKATPADKRRAILEAAIRVFARQGYHSTRVADIADLAEAAAVIDRWDAEVRALVDDIVFGVDDDTMESVVLDLRQPLLSAAVGEGDVDDPCLGGEHLPTNDLRR